MSRRVLLLTDIPPCTNYTAGLVTAQLCRHLDPGDLSVFCVQNRTLRPDPAPDLSDVPIRTVTKPGELGVTHIGGWRVPRPVAWTAEFRRRWLHVPPLIGQAVAYGREQGAEVLWAVLQGQTLVRMALPVARGLGAKLLVQVWDPLSWWLRAHAVDRPNRLLDQRAFDATLRAADGCAAASRAMAERYSALYGVPAQTIIAALDPALARAPPPRLHRDGLLVIGMAGQFYADAEWLALLSTLQAMYWRIGRRQVRLCILGGHAPPRDLPPERVEMLGWQPQAEAIRLLSERCDVLFCGYPSAPEMNEVAQLSFPAKLPTYFAAGRPVLFVGPRDSSPGRYLIEREAAACPLLGGMSGIQAALLRLVEDEDWYARLARAGQRAFIADFTLDRQRADFHRFLAFADATPAHAGSAAGKSSGAMASAHVPAR
jgi:hypothetical protein